MYTEGFEQWFKLNKNLTGPLNEWNKATTEMYRSLTQQNIEIMEENMSRLSNQFKRLSTVRKPEDLLNLQKDCISEDMTATMDYMQKLTHMSMDAMTKFSKLCGMMHTTTSSNSKSSDHSDK